MTDIAPSPNFMKGVYYLSLNTGRTLPGELYERCILSESQHRAHSAGRCLDGRCDKTAWHGYAEVIHLLAF